MGSHWGAWRPLLRALSPGSSPHSAQHLPRFLSDLERPGTQNCPFLQTQGPWSFLPRTLYKLAGLGRGGERKSEWGVGAAPTSVKRPCCFSHKGPRKERPGGRGPGLTFASCLVRKSTKPNPLCEPIPVIFFGKRTVFSSPKVLGIKTREFQNRGLQRGRGGGGRTDSHPLTLSS